MSVFVEIILSVVVWLLLNLVVAFILALIAYNLQNKNDLPPSTNSGKN